MLSRCSPLSSRTFDDDAQDFHEHGYGLPGRKKRIVVVMREVWLENRRREALVESSAEELD